MSPEPVPAPVLDIEGLDVAIFAKGEEDEG